MLDKTDTLGASHFASAYIQYVNNYDQSSRALKAAEDIVEWVYFEKHWRLLTKASGRGNYSVADLLIQPVQRIPRYKLLLEEVLKGTPADHPDHPLVAEALDRISTIATTVNEAIKRREAVEQALQPRNKTRPLAHACTTRRAPQ